MPSIQPRSRMLEIFISATTDGLAEYRAIATEVVAAQGYTPVVQEHFATPDEDLLDAIRRKLSQCRGVLAIVGPCFGFPRPPRPEDVVVESYTQFELNYMLQHKRPCRAFIASDTCTLKVRNAEPKDLQDLQQRFVIELRRLKRPGFCWTPFEDRQQFTLHLAKVRWGAWLDGD